MPVRFIQFQGTSAPRRGWLAPIIFGTVLAAGAVVLLAGAFIGVVLFTARGLLRLVTFAPRNEKVSQKERVPLWGTLRGFNFNKENEASPASPGEESKKSKTISLDRGRDGIWRNDE